MSAKIKDYIGIAAIIALVLVSVSAAGFARTYSKTSEPSSFRSFTVTGDGKAVGVPDIARFNFGVITEGGKDIAKLQKDNTAKSNAIIAFLKSSDIDPKDIRTVSYSVEPRYEYYSCPPVYSGGTARPCPAPQINGYTVSQYVEVKVRDFEKIGDVMGGVVEKGANSVSQLSFEMDDPTKVQSDARAEAIRKAKSKAEDLAKAGGFKIGRLLEISDGSPVIPVPFYKGEAYGRSGASDGAAPPIEPGSQEVNVTVTLKYEID